MLAQDLTAVMPVNRKSPLSVGKWAQVHRSWQATSLSSPTFFICPSSSTLLVHIPNLSIQVSPQLGASPLLCSACLHKSPTLIYAPAKLAVYAMPQPLSHPCPRWSCCQKFPPPASPSVKTPSPHMAHSRPCIPWSLFPGTYNCMCPLLLQSPMALGFCCCSGTCFTPYVVGIGEFVWSCLLSGTVWGQELCYSHSLCLMVPGTGLVFRSYCLWIELRTVLHLENISAMINKRDILLQNIREPMQAWAFICKVHYCDMQHFSSQK